MRYLPLTEPDRRAMLAAIGVESVDALFRDVPEAARRFDAFDLPARDVSLVVSELGDHAAALGAIAMAREAVEAGMAS